MIIIQLNLKNQDLEILIKNYARFLKIDITNFDELKTCFVKEKPDLVVHLAAQAGVRYSLENPNSYIQNNIVGFFQYIRNL